MSRKVKVFITNGYLEFDSDWTCEEVINVIRDRFCIQGGGLDDEQGVMRPKATLGMGRGTIWFVGGTRLSEDKPSLSPRLLASVYILCTEDLQPLGTAFAVKSKSDTLAASCAHCVCQTIVYEDGRKEYIMEGRKLILVTTLVDNENGRHVEGPVYRVHVLFIDNNCDLAVLKLSEPSASFPTTIPVCPANRMPSKANEDTVKLYHVPVVIFPVEVPTISAESITGLKIGQEDDNRYWVQVHTMPGSSGGPLVNVLGEVVGVVRTGIQPALQVSLVVPQVMVALVAHLDDSKHPDEMYIDRSDDYSDWSGHASTRLTAQYTQFIKINVHGFSAFLADN